VLNQDELTLLLFLPLSLFDLCSLSPGLEFFIYSSPPKETPSLFWAFFPAEDGIELRIKLAAVGILFGRFNKDRENFAP